MAGLISPHCMDPRGATKQKRAKGTPTPPHGSRAGAGTYLICQLEAVVEELEDEQAFNLLARSEDEAKELDDVTSPAKLCFQFEQHMRNLRIETFVLLLLGP